METKKYKVAILYLAIGRYSVFWKGFYQSSEKYFLENHNKTYFVFTDDTNIEYEGNENVNRVHQDLIKYPYATLMRYNIFNKIKDILSSYDYIYFFNANMRFVDHVGEEVFPNDENQGLVMAQHPGFIHNTPDEYAYDRNPGSLAYIPFGAGKYYFQGCLNGGRSKEYLELINRLDNAINKDLEKNILALWLDESYLNKYLLDKNPLILPPNYLYPEGWDLPEYKNNIKIVQIDKSNPRWGGLEYLKNVSEHNSIQPISRCKLKSVVRRCIVWLKMKLRIS